jgi:hypothetical protein
VPRHCNIAHSRYRDVKTVRNHFRGLYMKKNANSLDLAAKLTAAANKPAGAASVQPPVLVSPAAATTSPAEGPAPTTSRAKKEKAQPKEPDSVPITLRPSGKLLNKYVLKAAERTREEGRVVSAQQIMLEVLEGSVP